MSAVPRSVAGLAGLLGSVCLSFVCIACGGGDNVEPTATRSITHNAGNGQDAFTGSAVPTAPSVTVTEGGGSPVAGVPVTFQVTSGGGSVVPNTAINTDAQGIAMVTSWTLGTAPGSNTLSASTPGVTGSPVVFTATARAGATITGNVTVSSAAFGRRPGSVRTSTKLGAPLLQTARRALRQRKPAPEELIVRFRSQSVGAPSRGAPAGVHRTAAVRVQSSIRNRMASLLAPSAATLTGVSPAISAARVRVKTPADIDRVAAALRRDPSVAAVERNGYTWSAAGTAALSRPAAGPHAGASNDPLGAINAWGHGMIDLPEAWQTTTGSAEVLVAVISDGTRFDHPDVAANLSSDGYDFVANTEEVDLCSGGSLGNDGDGDGYDPDPTTPTSYFFDSDRDCSEGPDAIGAVGLSYAGIIGAVGNNGIGVSGVNWSVRIRPVRSIGVHGFALAYDMAQAILYAAGLPADDGHGGVVQAPSPAPIVVIEIVSPEDNPVVRDAVLAASGAGVLLIAPAVYAAVANPDPVYPAAYPEVMATSSVGADRELTAYSSFGPTIDIAAPAGDFAPDFSFGIGTTYWDFRADQPIYAFAGDAGIAAAHVAGVAALLQAQNPGLTAPDLRSRLTQHAIDAGAPGRDDRFGAGILNARNSLAQDFEPPRQLHALLYDAVAGEVIQTVAVAGDGSYSFTNGPGSYHVFAGQDEGADGLVGLPGRRWGAFGGSATPSSIDATAGGAHTASFTVGYPSELEPNATLTDARALPVGGYVSGVMAASSSQPDDGWMDTDVYRVLVPKAGQYTFETFGLDGACGLALEEDTVLGLFDPGDNQIALSDDIDTDGLNFCSRISAALQAGTYYLRVNGFRGGRYQVQARAGS